MNNQEKYEQLAQGETTLNSSMGIVPYSDDFLFENEIVKNLLSESSYFQLKQFSEIDLTEEDYAKKTYEALIEYHDEEFEVNIDLYPTDSIDFREYAFANRIDQDSLEAAADKPYYVEVSMFFSEDALESFHLQLKILDTLVPEASLIVDFMSYRLLSPKWLKMTAQSEIPPSPDYLYILHNVYDENGPEGSHRYWFHTHGLNRCGRVELEMVNITQGIEQMYTLLNMVVKKSLTDPSKEKQKFTIGYDGMGINMAWIRWEEGLKDFPADALGGLNDRQNQNIHAEPSGILFAVEDGNMILPEIYTSTLANNTIYYITTAETERMSALAKERFGKFKVVFDKEYIVPSDESLPDAVSSDEEEEARWTFLVKLGLTVDDAEGETEKEHLWFEVQSIQDDNITGILLNQPYWIAALNEGDVGTYPMELLTDWLIYSPYDTYTPDSIYLLEYE